VTAITLSYAGSPLPDAIAESEEQLLEQLQKAAFNYFVEHADATTGLVADTSRKGSPASIAVVGFALSCYPIGVERGWITRADAAAQTLKALRFFWNSPQGAEAGRHRLQGLLLPFPRYAVGTARMELRVVADRHHLAAGRHADCSRVFHRTDRRGIRNPRAGRGALPPG
jgi:hypothetical protein